MTAPPKTPRARRLTPVLPNQSKGERGTPTSLLGLDKEPLGVPFSCMRLWALVPVLFPALEPLQPLALILTSSFFLVQVCFSPSLPAPPLHSPLRSS